MADGNEYVIKKGTEGAEVQIQGQLEGTVTFTGVPVSTQNKANGGAPEYLDGVMQGQGVTFAGTFTPKIATEQNAVKNDSWDGTQDNYTIEDAYTGEAWTANFVVSARSDSAPLNGATTMSVTFLSSGEVTHTEPTAA